jgi:hypothetical protein
MACRPFASRGQMTVGAICALCDARDFTYLKAAVLARFRAGGMADAREIEVGHG